MISRMASEGKIPLRDWWGKFFFEAFQKYVARYSVACCSEVENGLHTGVGPS